MTKTKNTGGLVTTQSIKEQLMYEIHDPASYITPDVVADFSKITLEGIEKDHGIKAIGVAPVISKIILKTNTFILMIWLNAVNLP